MFPRIRPFEVLVQDLRLAARLLRRSPGFSALAIVTLALGIGANTAIFSVINGAILTPLPFRHADRVVRVWASQPARNLPFFSVSAADYLDWRASARSFEAMAAYDRQRGAILTGTAISGDGGPEEVLRSNVDAAIFDLLGVSPAIGRGLTVDDDQPGAAPTVVLSHGLWQRRFGSDPRILGTSLVLDGRPHTIVGVMPRSFEIPNAPAELWTPLRLARAEADRLRGSRYLRVLARLRSGATIEEGRAELVRLAAAQSATFTDTNGGWSVSVRPLFDTVVDDRFRTALLVVAGIVGMVLLIACANVASLLLARSVTRRQELAIRAALGAGQRRLVTQLLTESGLLALIAAGAALVLAFWSLEALRALEPANVPRLAEIQLDWRVLVFTLIAALASALLFGAIPARRAARWDLLSSLQSSAKGNTAAAGGRDWLRPALVVGQVGLALVILVGAALMVQSLAGLRRLDPGFDDRGVVVMDVNLPAAKYPTEATPAFYDRLLARAAGLPGVTVTGAVSSLPFGPNTGMLFLPEGMTVSAESQAPDANVRTIAGDYFRALHVPLRRGRVFEPGDRDGATPVAIINETMARRHWAGRDPIGQRLRMGGAQTGPWWTIVGVAADMRYQSLEDLVERPMIYFPLAQMPSRSMSLVLRAAGDPAGLAAPLRGALAALDRDQPAARVTTMTAMLGSERAQRRFETTLFVAIGGLALVLAIVGLYGLMSGAVAERRHEMGVRMALGATPRELLMLVLRRGIGLVVAGIAIGVTLSLALGSLLDALLFGIRASDPITLMAIPAALLLVAIVACVIPASRVLRLDPVRALRD